MPIAAILLPCYLLVTQFGAMQQHDTPRAHWQALLASNVLPGAILISNDRDELTPLYYLQLVEAVRPDLIGLFPLIAPDPRMAQVVSLTQFALETARPVYFIKPMNELSVKFRLQPQGALVRVEGLQSTQPDHPLLHESATLNLLGWSHIPPLSPQAPMSVLLYWQVSSASRSDLKTYIHVLDGNGRRIAQSDHVPGGDFYPPSQWVAGETLYDMHTITLPSGTRGPLQLVAGAYWPDGAPLDGLARIELGTASVGE